MNTQLDLFDAASGKPLHRVTDPDTSRDAAAETAVVLSDLQHRLFDFARTRRNPFTSRELAEYFGRNVDRSHDVETYRKRVRELERKGLLEEAGRVACQFTTKSAMSFRVADPQS